MTTSSLTPGPLPPEQPATAAAAAAAVLNATMAETHGATGEQLAEAAGSAGILFDAAHVEAAVGAAREQARAELAAELAEVHEAAEIAAYFKARYDRLQRLLAGHPDSHLMSVGEILAAVDGQNPRAGAPLVVEWDGVVMGPSGDTANENTLVPCTTLLGGPAALVLKPAQSADLARRLAAVQDEPEADDDGVDYLDEPTQGEDIVHPCGCPKRFDRHAWGCPATPAESQAAQSESEDL